MVIVSDTLKLSDYIETACLDNAVTVNDKDGIITISKEDYFCYRITLHTAIDMYERDMSKMAYNEGRMSEVTLNIH